MACNTLRAGPDMASAGEIRGPPAAMLRWWQLNNSSLTVLFFPGAKLPGPEHKAFVA